MTAGHSGTGHSGVWVIGRLGTHGCSCSTRGVVMMIYGVRYMDDICVWFLAIRLGLEVDGWRTGLQRFLEERRVGGWNNTNLEGSRMFRRNDE